MLFRSTPLRVGAAATAGIASIVLVLATSAAAAPASQAHQQVAAVSSPVDPVAFRGAMAKLWEDHITWTRLYVISALSDAPDLPQTTDRLLQNQADIGNAIRPFYGDAAGDQLTDLLRQHILIAADVVASAKAGDADGLNTNMQRWQANADDIGDFLGAANPDAWPADKMKTMMREHLDLTTAEVVARLHQDWSGDIAAYDRVHLHILGLADDLTNGIEAQFPDAFESASASAMPALMQGM